MKTFRFYKVALLNTDRSAGFLEIAACNASNAVKQLRNHEKYVPESYFVTVITQRDNRETLIGCWDL